MSNGKRPFATPEAGLAQVMIGSTETPCGMAFLVSPRLAVTCAHVVNVALGRDKHDPAPLPGDAKVMVRFPLAHDLPRDDGGYDLPERCAAVPAFKSPGRLPTDDLALLELEEQAPWEVGETVLADIRGVSLEHDELGLFGPPQGSKLVVHFDARFAGKVNPSWAQLDPVSANGDFVAGGFSGGRVWSYAHDAAIGMMVATQVSSTQRRAFMIPAAAIRSFRPLLSAELRSVGPNFCSIWTVFATCFLLILLTHFLGERIGNYPDVLALGGGNTVVSGFFGLNINAILMPITLAMLLRFSSGYSEHPWWMRLPQFGRFKTPAKPTASKKAAIVTLALFVAGPLYAQAHFLRTFHANGEVYIYPGKFGFSSEELEMAGETCYRRSVHYCTHFEARPFSTVTPKPGFSGNYIDNAYHYGDRAQNPPDSVTFFPIVQPAVLWGLYLASLGIAALLVLRVFATPSRCKSLRF